MILESIHKSILYYIKLIMEKLINQKYRLEPKELGSGAFSQVFLGMDIDTNQQVAIKKISLQKSLPEYILKETELMQSLDHPNIVKYYDVVKMPECWYIIMEYCNIGTLADVIKFNEEMAKNKSLYFNREANTYHYLNQLKDALNYLRRKGCIHRDIKPMNILLTKHVHHDSTFLIDSGTIFKSDEQLANNIDKSKLDHSEKIIVKLADFGLAKSFMDNEDSLMNTICGSPLYMAPELLFNKEYNSKADLWSFGVIMYELLYGIHPYNAFSYAQLKKKLKSQSINFHLNKNFTSHCFDLVTKLLVKDPHKRINWVELFKHKWFTHWKNRVNDGDTIFMPKMSTNSPNLFSNDNPNNNPNNNSNGPLVHFGAPTQPIKIVNPKISAYGFPENASPKFSTQIGLIGPPNISLGPSNLSRMKLDNFSKNYIQGSYFDYPSSYPPTDPRRKAFESNLISSKSPVFETSVGPNSNANAKHSVDQCIGMGHSHSCGTPPSMSKMDTTKSRIFQNFNTIKNPTNPINITGIADLSVSPNHEDESPQSVPQNLAYSITNNLNMPDFGNSPIIYVDE
jgi:serine/threonine protein kinase